MPCYDNYPEIETRELKKRLDLATRLLCALCKAMHKAHSLEEVAERLGEDFYEIRHWYQKHKKMDEGSSSNG